MAFEHSYARYLLLSFEKKCIKKRLEEHKVPFIFHTYQCKSTNPHTPAYLCGDLDSLPMDIGGSCYQTVFAYVHCMNKRRAILGARLAVVKGKCDNAISLHKHHPIRTHNHRVATLSCERNFRSVWN